MSSTFRAELEFATLVKLDQPVSKWCVEFGDHVVDQDNGLRRSRPSWGRIALIGRASNLRGDYANCVTLEMICSLHF